MIIISEYSNRLKNTAGNVYLKKLTDAALLLEIPIFFFERNNITSLKFALERKQSTFQSKETVLWLGYVPSFDFYTQVYQLLNQHELLLIHTPKVFSIAEYFDLFYPLIENLTMKSLVVTSFEEGKKAATVLEYPVFVKGTIQSLKKLGWQNCVAHNEKELNVIISKVLKHHDFSLGKVILRKFVPLYFREVGGNQIPKAHEYRFFVLNEKIVDYSYYWNGKNPFQLKKGELEYLQNLAIKTAKQVNIPFISVDIAQTQVLDWVVIEIGDGQFSDIRGISPLKWWNFLKSNLK